MVKSIISCGKYDKKYKYMIYYILIRLVLEYFLGDVDFPDEMKIEFLRNEFFPKSILIFDMFRSFGMIIFAIMLLNFESKNIEEKNKNKNKISELQLISFNEPVELIHYETKKPTSRFYMIIIIALLYNINSKLIKFFYQFGFLGIDLWMIQILNFLENTNYYLPNKKSIFQSCNIYTSKNRNSIYFNIFNFDEININNNNFCKR